MTDSSGFLNRRYEADAAVEAVYEKDMPWSAYLTLGRNLTRRDLWIGIGEVILAVVLWSIGKIFGLPFYPPPIMPARRIILKGYQRARELRKEPTPAEGPQNATVLLSHFFWGGCRKTKGIAFAVVLWKTGVVEKLKYSLFYT